jgi:hypothetical protein
MRDSTSHVQHRVYDAGQRVGTMGNMGCKMMGIKRLIANQDEPMIKLTKFADAGDELTVSKVDLTMVSPQLFTLRKHHQCQTTTDRKSHSIGNLLSAVLQFYGRETKSLTYLRHSTRS